MSDATKFSYVGVRKKHHRPVTHCFYHHITTWFKRETKEASYLSFNARDVNYLASANS